MAKGTRSNGDQATDSTMEGVDVREMLQKLVSNIGTFKRGGIF